MGVREVLATTVALAALATTGVAASGTGGAATAAEATAGRPVPEVLAGDTWLRHLREDLLPYWEMPVALGEPLGNFPTWRDELGQLDPERGTFRGVSTLARGVYGYSVAFHLTGDEKYLTYARAGLEWLDKYGRDAKGGWYHDLLDTGAPRNPTTSNRELFDLASVGMAYGAYFNITRDPKAEEGLLGVHDLIFSKYRNPITGDFLDALGPDMETPVDLGRGSGQDITNLLVPGAATLLPYADLLSDAERRAQFRKGLRTVVDVLILRHRNTSTPETWWFWGRAGRREHVAAETDFGHTIKSHELINNANQVFPDRPWNFMASDRDVMLGRAWDDAAARWHQDMDSFDPAAVVPESNWWTHAEADQTLAALDLREDFTRSDWLARSAGTWLDTFVDPEFPHEVWSRPRSDDALSVKEKAGRGKNMYHVFEHALVMFLHGRAMEGRPAELHYALPEDLALTGEAEPYWFDATTEHRVVGGPVGVLEGHRHVVVELSGLDDVPEPLFPPPPDDTAPATQATLDPPANDAGWHRGPVSLTLRAGDTGVGVREVRAQVRDLTGAAPAEAWIEPGEELTLPLTAQGDYVVAYAAVDRLGNTEPTQTLRVRVDRTAPTVSGLPTQPCQIWPPNERMVTVAQVVGADDFSGLASVDAEVSVDEPSAAGDVQVLDGRVRVRAVRDDEGDGRVYTVTATAADAAGNVTTAAGSCTVPHDVRLPLG